MASKASQPVSKPTAKAGVAKESEHKVARNVSEPKGVARNDAKGSKARAEASDAKASKAGAPESEAKVSKAGAPEADAKVPKGGAPETEAKGAKEGAQASDTKVATAGAEASATKSPKATEASDAKVAKPDAKTPDAKEPDAKTPKAPESNGKTERQPAGIRRSTTSTLQFKHIFTHESPGTITDHYKMDKKLLGEGSYGMVCKGQKITKGAPSGADKDKIERAIKAIDISKISDKHRFELEVAIQAKLDHPHIVKLYEVFKDAKRMYLVMELCTGGELFDRIVAEAEKNADLGDNGQAFDERGAANYMQQIIGAMRYLHSLNFVHRDIKPENFLLQNKSADSPLKVIDFGLAKSFTPGEPMKTKAGTPYYVSPQVLAGNYDEKCDIWSCGVIAYILLCGYPPFFGDDDEKILRAVKKGDFDFPSPDWDNITPAAKDMIKSMLTFDQNKRPSAEMVLDHVWLSDHADKPRGEVQKDLGSKLRNFTGVSKLKKVALTLIAQQLNEGAIEELKNTFNILDKNKDGTLTMREIEEGMKSHKVTLPADLHKTLKALDTDGSGSVDYTEFIAATLSTQQYLKKEVLWSAFRTFDKDGDGQITKKELRTMCHSDDDGSSTASTVIEKQINDMMAEADLNGDGSISWEEFQKMMEVPQPS